MIPDDLSLWRSRQDAGDPNPWSPSLRFLAGDEQPSVLDTSYLTADDLADSDVAANVAAMSETSALITWVAEDEDESLAFGYWRGPGDLPLTEAPIVTLDSEGQFRLTYGGNVSEAVNYEFGQWNDEGYAGLVQACRDLGVTIQVESEDDFAEPVASPTPGEFHAASYQRLRNQS